MDEKDYELLLELYVIKNITRVSQKLFLSQPALTKRLKNIEEELKCQLMVRSKKGVIFTPMGESIIPYIKEIYNTSLKLKSHTSSSQGYVGGTLSLGASLNFSRYRLPAVIKKFTDLYPMVEIEITTGQSKNLYQMLQNDEISIAVVRGDFKWNEGNILLYREPLCLVTSSENSEKLLDSYPYIGRYTDSLLSEEVNLWLAENNLPGQKTRLWIDNIDSCKEMSRLGIGWCILPQICLDDFQGHKEEIHLKDGRPLERKTYILYKNSYYKLPQLKLFIELLIESLA